MDEANEPILRAPGIVVGLIIVFFIVHVASQFLSEAQYEYLIGNFALIPALVSAGGGDTLAGTLHVGSQFITYAFLHGDFTHLLFNSVWFLIFATAVARRIGPARFLLFSFLAAVGAGLTHVSLHWGEPMPVVGASGAISGLMGAAFRFIFVNPNELVWPPARLPLFSRPVLSISLLWVVLNVVVGVTGYSPQGFGQAIAWEAHLGGYFTGLLIFPLFDRRRSWIS